ncbi:MAG: PAS domain-containing protein [Shewanellaceae bacterium]|nr:PAS domain-containing protein [Shewanellaceae bacterium]
MSLEHNEVDEMHWLIDIIQNIEVGLVVIDTQYNIQLWNGFMESYSNVAPNTIKGQNLFVNFPEIEQSWFEKKVNSMFNLKIRTFINWKQRPYLFKFSNHRPLSSPSEFMYQNITMTPLTSLTGKVTHISIMIYDVSEEAIQEKSEP